MATLLKYLLPSIFNQFSEFGVKSSSVARSVGCTVNGLTKAIDMLSSSNISIRSIYSSLYCFASPFKKSLVADTEVYVVRSDVNIIIEQIAQKQSKLMVPEYVLRIVFKDITKGEFALFFCKYPRK